MDVSLHFYSVKEVKALKEVEITSKEEIEFALTFGMAKELAYVEANASF